MEYLVGTYLKDIYRNEENGYTVGKIRVLNDAEHALDLGLDREMVITGYFAPMVSGRTYHFYGKFVENQYGRQFEVSHYELENHNDKESLVAFLSSDLFKGIGKTLAQRIVDTLGAEALNRIVENPDVLTTIKGISPQKAQMIHDAVVEHYASEQIIRYLMNHGFGSRLAFIIFQRYREQTIEKLEKNPYILIRDIDGIGFIRADQFAQSIGYDLKSPHRIRASIAYLMNELCYSAGYTYVTKEELLEGAMAFLNRNGLDISVELVEECLEELIRHREIIREDDRYYLPSLYEAEETVVETLYLLVNHEKRDIDENKVEELIQQSEKSLGITYTDCQKEAIYKAIVEPVLIVTGGPGTGKTTVVSGIIRVYQALYGLKDHELSETIALVAPTGRAAKRLQETTGVEAMTIHRLLRYNHYGLFEKGKDNPITQRLLICDESSMLDIQLASQLLEAVTLDTQIVFVGDVNQLPSVGPGQVLKDLIDSQAIPTVTLHKIQRQKDTSTIIELAHDINQGLITPDHFKQQHDRNFIRASNPQILEHLVFIVQNALKKGFSIDDIQILAPIYRGEVGIQAINAKIQEAVNAPGEGKKELQVANQILRQGDKVIQLVNRPTDFVMNGDIGFITHIFDEPGQDRVKMVVRFDDVEVKYTESELDQVALAYCISIHKAQGSEFAITVLVLSSSYSIMLRRKLVYTAVTRAKQSLIILGDPKAYVRAVRNDREQNRQSTLQQKLAKAFKSNILTIDGFEFERQAPHTVTPYDFMDEDVYYA